MNRYKPRHFLVLGAIIVLPLLMLGVAPALQVLIPRIAALRGQIEILEGESQMVKEQIEPLEAESLEPDAPVTMIGAELGADDLRVFDAKGVGIDRSIDASLQGGVTIYLEEPAVAAELIYDPADLGLTLPLAVPLVVAPAGVGP
jgi:hypothetical protein